MPDLAVLALRAFRTVLADIDDNLGPAADLTYARSVARSTWTALVEGALLPELERTFRDAFNTVMTVPVVSSSTLADRYLASIRPNLDTVFDRFLNDVERRVTAAATAGLTPRDVARTLLEAAGDEPWRAERIALTETNAARNAGLHHGAVVAEALLDQTHTKTWVTTHDERVRGEHVATDSQTVTLGQMFDVAGHTAAYPGDPTLPADLRINCRCALRVTVVPDAVLASGATMNTPTLADPIVDPAVEALAEGLPTATPTHTGPPDGFRGCLAPMGVMSGDGRRIMRTETLRHRPLPMPMQWQQQSTGGHENSVVAARLDRVWFETHDDHDCLHGEGAFDLGGDEGLDLARRVGEGFAGNVSVDLIDVTASWQYVLPDGTEVPEPTSFEEYLDLLAAGVKEVMSATDWQLAATTFVAIPAFGEARVEGVWGYKPTPVEDCADCEEAALLAAGAPYPGEHVYDAASFSLPEARTLTPLTIDGNRVYGHIADWKSCNTGYSVCRTAPRSASGYAYFHLGAVLTTDGELAIGKLTVGEGHADPKLGMVAAMAHYDATSTAVAVVRAIDGKHGVWVSGEIIDGTPPAKVSELRRSPISGDWRQKGYVLEMVAAHAVNTPGYAIPRQGASDRNGRQLSLVAAGPPPSALPASERFAGHVDPKAIAREVLAQVKAEERANADAERLAQRVADARAEDLAARVLPAAH